MTGRTWARNLSLLAIAATSTPTLAGGLVGDLEWQDSLDAAKAVLEERCESTRIIAVEPPSFPLAANEERHYVCETLTTKRGCVQRAVFVFGDDQLKMIEARGGAVAALGSDGDSSSYMHYQIFDDGERWIDKDNDAVWFLSKAARHPNLFTFSNPFLAGQPSPPVYESSAAVPSLLDFAVTLEDAKSRYLEECPIVHAEETRVFLPTKPEKQAQVNCFGYEYAGFPRKFEAIYGDGQLEMVWILTAKEEEARVRALLEAEYGPAETVNENWEIYDGMRVSLRKDKPEILLLSDRLVPHYREEIIGQ